VTRTLRRSATLALALAATTALAACTSDSASDTVAAAASAAASVAPGTASASASASPSTGDEPGCEDARGKTVGYSEPIPDPNFAQIEKIMRSGLDQYGVELKTTNANLNPGKQLSDIRTLLQGGIDVLVINPLAVQAIEPALSQVRDKDVPIVAQETRQGGPYATNVTADVETAVSEATAQIKAEGEGGKVAAVTGPPLAEILVRENTAFEENAKKDGLTVVESQANTQISPAGAKAVADGYKQKYGNDLTAIWTFNDTSAVGIASSFGPDFQPELYSINGQPEAIPFVKDGRITATWDLRQDKLGQALAYAALQALCNKELPKEIVVPVQKIDKSNVESYRPLSDRANDPFQVELEERDGRTFIKIDE